MNPQRLRVVTYNIHKGVQGVGPARRLEIHNLAQEMAGFDADLICLQEVRSHHRKLAQRFPNWPAQGQAESLLPSGYEAVYRTNALTRHGAHGNALLTRWPVDEVAHEDVSDHRFEQRGLLHVRVRVAGVPVHVIVLHLGLFASSRLRQVERLGAYVARAVPADERLLVAGDFNDWGLRLGPVMRGLGFQTFDAWRLPTFPSRLPLLHLDRVYARGLQPLAAQVPQGARWARLSDHLPLITEFGW
jgi:endonuclease/exonuclease/phosphatase family metal-dependent hydrolase